MKTNLNTKTANQKAKLLKTGLCIDSNSDIGDILTDLWLKFDCLYEILKLFWFRNSELIMELERIIQKNWEFFVSL